ncbi:c-type cytochrome [endosymbiont of unidentified scaly snail isolate Monju]|uniref:c-type cytochrome n=1 Tax=endosymbiont of unidentified scaly snail isolate Monju TaxID=1248727 RepID=UPI000389271F|nr:c-type cytochrome [endosymbiont of unidentified scaly snail isolate Monju]BAN68309.1 cytochrome c, class I [endosymbiont of unidentified scaly snail isolate Monju]
MLKTRTLAIALLGAGLAFAIMPAIGTADVNSLAEKCGECHGKDGNSSDPKVPNIAGYSAKYIEDALEDYRDGERPGLKFKKEDGTETDMVEIAKKLSEDNIKAIAEYYSGQTFKSHAGEQETDPRLVARGEKIFKRKCKKCHTDFGTDPEDDAGILGGQWMEYLRHQFEMFASGEREMPKKMKKKFRKLKKEDYEAIIHALGSK